MGTKIKRYAILTPFDKPEVVAGIAALQKLDVQIVGTKSGALVVRELPVPQYDEWDIRNILGPDDSDLEELGEDSPSDNAPAVAAFLSRLTKYGVVLIDVDLGEDTGFEAGISGVVRARRFIGGESGDEIGAGLLLNSLDPVIERIVLGEKTADDYGAVHSLDVTPAEIVKKAREAQASRASEKPTKQHFWNRKPSQSPEPDSPEPGTEDPQG
ncbi:MAG: hypothetical protein ACTHW1_10430 [Ancrocorticia sp.]|uniref:hypothetical protein n=1 Tax=Ancrocorticia sp. TaxID=2593684 RepID=UPI003F8FADFD